MTGLPRRRARDLLGRRAAGGRATWTASARCRAAAAAISSSWTCRSARSSSTTPSGRRPAPSPASRPGSTRSGESTDGCRGRRSARRLCGSRARAYRCRRRTSACLAMLEPVMTMREGARMYAPTGRLLEPGERLEQPGLVRALELVAEEGARSAYEGSIAESLLELVAERGGVVTRADLTSYQAVWSEPVEVPYAGTRFLTRAGLAPVGPALERLPALRGLGEPERTLGALRRARRRARRLVTHDEPRHGRRRGQRLRADHEPRARLGRLAPRPRPAPEQHARRGRPRSSHRSSPGARMESMMSPSVALDGGGPVLAIGAAGGTRLRTALVTAASAILDEASLPRRRSTGRGSTGPATSSTPSRASTSRRSPSSSHVG